MTDLPEGRPLRRLVLGIGNPGARYEGTRHNAGFDVLDIVAGRRGASWQPGFEGDLLAQGSDAEGAWVLLKPTCFVNRSGVALRRYLDRVDGDLSRVLIVADDMALLPGRLRLRAGGTAGGHNGLRSVIAELGTEAVPRLRVGIGSAPVGEWTGHVLGRYSGDEVEVMHRALARAAECVEAFLTGCPLHDLAAEWNRSLPRGPASGTEAPGVRDMRRTGPSPEGSEETPAPPEV